jgi:hypothetical protein
MTVEENDDDSRTDTRDRRRSSPPRALPLKRRPARAEHGESGAEAQRRDNQNPRFQYASDSDYESDGHRRPPPRGERDDRRRREREQQAPRMTVNTGHPPRWDIRDAYTLGPVEELRDDRPEEGAFIAPPLQTTTAAFVPATLGFGGGQTVQAIATLGTGPPLAGNTMAASPEPHCPAGQSFQSSDQFRNRYGDVDSPSVFGSPQGNKLLEGVTPTTPWTSKYVADFDGKGKWSMEETGRGVKVTLVSHGTGGQGTHRTKEASSRAAIVACITTRTPCWKRREEPR